MSPITQNSWSNDSSTIGVECLHYMIGDGPVKLSRFYLSNIPHRQEYQNQYHEGGLFGPCCCRFYPSQCTIILIRNLRVHVLQTRVSFAVIRQRTFDMLTKMQGIDDE